MSDNLNPVGNNPEEKKDELNMGLKVLSFCIPLAGAIIYFVKKGEEPKSAQTACYAALIGAGVAIVLNIIAGVLGMGAGGY